MSGNGGGDGNGGGSESGANSGTSADAGSSAAGPTPDSSAPAGPAITEANAREAEGERDRHEAPMTGFRGLSERDLATVDESDRVYAKAPDVSRALVDETDHVRGMSSSFISFTDDPNVAARYATDTVAVVSANQATDLSSDYSLRDPEANLNATRDRENLTGEPLAVIATYSKHGANGFVDAKGEVVHDLSSFGTPLADGRVQYDFTPEVTRDTVVGLDGEETVVERPTGRSVVQSARHVDYDDSRLEGHLG